MAKKRLLASRITTRFVVLKKIPAIAISTYLRNASRQNLSDLEKRNLSWLVKNEYISTNVIKTSNIYLNF